MPERELQYAVILGSVRSGRFGDTVACWFTEILRRDERIAVDLLDPAEIRLPTDLSGGGDTEEYRRRVDAADAVVIITPEYNHGYPAALKTMIDTVREEWQAKPIGFVSYGGVSGGLRAVEQLRGVFGELHAVPLRDSVSFAHAEESFAAAGNPLDPQTAERRTEPLLRTMLWWARTLRDARRRVPYPA